MNPKIDDPEAFPKRVAEICQLYRQAHALRTQRVHVVSCDEKTGIQALERMKPTKLPKPGQIEKREYEYPRHGTLSLIGSFDVVTGNIVGQSIGPTRNESDFVEHIKTTVAAVPEAQWVLVCDQLNTHKSESLVRWIIQECSLDISAQELGLKGKSGLLKSLQTGAKFLEDPSHRIRILYTPKHGPWLNQIEIWFGILSAKVIRRGSFTSLEDLASKISSFIDYFSKTARPFKWTFKGFPLEA